MENQKSLMTKEMLQEEISFILKELTKQKDKQIQLLKAHTNPDMRKYFKFIDTLKKNVYTYFDILKQSQETFTYNFIENFKLDLTTEINGLYSFIKEIKTIINNDLDEDYYDIYRTLNESHNKLIDLYNEIERITNPKPIELATLKGISANLTTYTTKSDDDTGRPTQNDDIEFTTKLPVYIDWSAESGKLRYTLFKDGKAYNFKETNDIVVFIDNNIPKFKYKLYIDGNSFGKELVDIIKTDMSKNLPNDFINSLNFETSIKNRKDLLAREDKVLICVNCGKSNKEHYYYMSNSTSDGRMNICKDCLKKRITNSDESINFKELINVLKENDIVYLDHIWTGDKLRGSVNIIGEYLRIINSLSQYKGLRFKNSQF